MNPRAAALYVCAHARDTDDGQGYCHAMNDAIRALNGDDDE